MPEHSTENLFPPDVTLAEIDDEDDLDPDAPDAESNTPGSTHAATESAIEPEEPYEVKDEPVLAAEPEDEPEPEPEPEDEPADQSDESESSTVLDQGPFINNGLTKYEAVALVGVTIPSYCLAAFILQQMMLHGIHHAPPALWIVFGVLVIIPITLLFGTELATRLLTQITSARRDHK